VSKPNLEEFVAGLQLPLGNRERERPTGADDDSKLAAESVFHRFARLEGDYQQLEKSRDAYKARVDALELALTTLRKSRSDAVLQAQWLELELEALKNSRVFRATQAVRYLSRRIRKHLRLLKRFAYAVYRFGPSEAVRRARAYLDYRKLFRKSRTSPFLSAHDTRSDSGGIRAAVTPSFATADDRTPWAMYVSDFYDGGLEKVVLDLAVGLSARGKSCAIIVKGESGRAGEAARKMGINVVEFKGDAAAIRRFILEHRIARLITHHCYDFLEEIAATGVTIDEVIHNAYHWQRGNQALCRLRNQFIANCISVSEFVNSYAITELKVNPGKLRIIHNGLAREGLIRPPVALMKQRRKETFSDPVFVMLANEHLQKNHLAVLHAMKEISANFPAVKLYMCGVIEESTDLGRTIRATAEKLKLSESVEFTGPLDREGVSRLLSRAHIALLPTTMEGFSIASLEYCYFGLPMILSNTGASVTFENAYASVILASDVALPANQLDSMKIERFSLYPDKRCVAGIVAAMNSVLTNYQHYLDQAELAANDWESYAIETTVDHYLQLDSEPCPAV
jgi:glycosyltransferase involved in cell wall biosynthesis